MAVFNPQISPTQDPNYLGYAKVVDAPAPDQSTGLALSTAAHGLEGLVKATDTSIKAGIDNETYKRIDPERDKMTSALETIKSNTAASVVPAPVQTTAGTTTGSLLDANASMDAPEVPDGVDQGLERITQLSEARKAQKINDTQYSGNVLSIAKQLRAQYPGYREYVDEKVSQVSGLPVANAYYKNLMEDINRQLVQAQGQGNKIEGLYLKNLDVPNITQYWEAYKTGKLPESQFIGKIASWQNLQTQYKVDASKRAEETDNRDLQIKNETRRATTNYSNEINMGLQDVTAMAGGTSAGAIIKYIEDAATGKISATPMEIDQRKTQLAAITQAHGRALWVRAHTPGEDGSSTASIIGEDATKKLISDVMVPMTSFVELANSKDSSPAFLAARQNEAILNNDKNKFLINKQTGPAARQMQTARGILGEQYFPDFLRSMLANGTDDPFKDLLSQEALSAIAPITDVRGQPIPRTMKDAITHGKEVNAPAEFHGSVVGLVSTIADPKMPLQAKDKMIEWAFNPKNVGRLDELKMDYRDPNTGEMVPGKYRAFNLMSSPAITQSVAETAKVHPENYVKYQGTLEKEFGVLFRTDVAKLSQITDKTYLNAHFSWNEKTNELGLVDKNNRPITYNYRALGIEQPNAVYLNGALEVVERVNSGLRNLANVQKMNPAGAGDTTQYIFQTLKDANFRPGREIAGAQDVMKSVFKSRNPDATPEDLDKMLLRVRPSMPAVQPLDAAPDRSAAPPISRFAPESRSPSVSEFVSNPTGEPLPKAPRGIRGNLSDERLIDIKTDDIPEGMSARDFIKQLKDRRSDSGSIQMAANMTNNPDDILEGTSGGKVTGGKSISGYHIWDNQNRSGPISGMYKPDKSQRRRASTRADKMNLEYGAHRYSIRPVYEDYE